MQYDPKALVATALQQALALPKTFFPVPIREAAATTTPCFRDRVTKEELSWALAGALLRCATLQQYVTVILTAYVTACRNPKGQGLTETLSRGLGEGPLLPPASLFAPMDDTVAEIVIGLGRTLLKLRERYELVLPRLRPSPRELEQARIVLVDQVRYLVRADPERARLYVDRVSAQLIRALEKKGSRRPPPV